MNLKKTAIDIIHFLGLLLIFVAVCSVLEYFLHIANVITPIRTVVMIFQPLENLISQHYSSTITFQGQTYSNIHLVLAIILLVMSFGVNSLVNVVEFIDVNYENFTRIRRVKSEKIYSANIQKNYAKTYLDNVGFYISFKLSLKESSYYSNSDPTHLERVRAQAYSSFYDVFGKYFFIKSFIKNDKLIIICDNFKRFDEIFIEFMKHVQKITKDNTDSYIKTTAYFVVDVLKDCKFNDESEKFVEKIIKYGYRNKVVTTSVFAERYSAEINGKFQSVSMGTFRIYKNDILNNRNADIFDENRQQNNDYEDCELHVVSRKLTKSKN